MNFENNYDHVYALQSLVALPHKILSRHDVDNLTEYVLYELCHNSCLKLDQAAYFVDNPDFNQFRGIAGISRSEHPEENYCIWSDSEKFRHFMDQSDFNEKVKSIVTKSQKSSNKTESEFMNNVAKELEFKSHNFHVLDIKHGNRGFFMYQPMKNHSKELQNLVANAVSFLGFCPLF